LSDDQRTEARKQLFKALDELLIEAERKPFCSGQIEFKVKDGRLSHFETSMKESHKI